MENRHDPFRLRLARAPSGPEDTTRDDTPVRESDQEEDLYATLRNCELRIAELELLLAESRASLAESIERTQKAEAASKEGAPFACLTLDQNWLITDANQVALTLLRSEREEIVGSSLWSFLNVRIGTGPYYYYYYYRCLAAVRENRTVDFESFSPVRNKWLKIHASPGATGLKLWLQDLTDDKKRLETQSRLWNWQKSLADNAPDIIMRFDVTLRCIFANKAARDIGETESTALVGKKYDNMGLPAEAAERFAGMLRKAASSRTPVSEEVDITVEDTTRYFSVRAVPELTGTSVVRSILVIAQDITEQKKLETQLREAQKLEAVGTLSGGVAHDFNNLLAVILGNAELALDDAIEASPMGQNLKNVRTAALRGRDLVRQILSFSRQASQNRKSLSLTPLVKETARLLRSTISATVDIRVETRAKRDTVLADPVQIQQILVNLATNATQAMPTGGVMTIDLREVSFAGRSRLPHPDLRHGDYLALQVTDTGTGMSAEVRERIFEPFYTTKERQGGTGLGLSVVYGIVKSHEGTITVQTEPGKGSAFTVFLPLMERPITEVQEGPEHEVRGKGRILFVDDEELVAEMARETLSRLGYDVVPETDPKKALETFSDNGPFDLVITDYAMPGISGLALAQQLLASRPGTSIILCTGYSEAVDEKTARAAGISAFFMKPYTKAELSQIVGKIFEKAPQRKVGRD